jgi:hypothetical protein
MTADMMQKQMEQLGLPTPQPPKQYKQRYPESLGRILSSLAWSVISRAIGIPLLQAIQIWFLLYLVVVVVLYALRLPKEFAIGNEIQLCFRHCVAFAVVYVLIDNGISTFSE